MKAFHDSPERARSDVARNAALTASAKAQHERDHANGRGWKSFWCAARR